jgi:hypothetical protein
MGSFTPPIQPGTRYRVYMTPRTGQFTYGTEIEITDHVTIQGIGTTKRAIDSQDYEIGVYFYSDLQLVGSNDNGYFNGPDDLRSIFQYNRDLTKCRVVYENTTGDTIAYYGLLQDQATRIDAVNETVTFRILSLDSIISITQVTGGTVASGVTCKSAMLSILNQAAISSVLSISSVNVTPDLNFTIDIGDAFDDMQTQDALNLLLVASNSTMKISSSGVVTIQSRAANNVSALNLYGPYDELRRQNVINIQNYNTGLQRMFTSVIITDANGVDTTFDNVPLAQTYGYNQTALTFPFLLANGSVPLVGKTILAEFSSPKVEMEVEVPTSIAKNVDLLDLVSVNWPLRITPITDKMLPVIGTSVIGNSAYPLPNKNGSLFVLPNVAFKVIEIDNDAVNFTTILKLRQVGTTISDGYFNNPTSSVIGFAVIGSAAIGGTGSTDAKWNPSALGAARVGSTVLSH